MMEQSVLADSKRWFKDLLKAGEAAIEAAESCPLDDDPENLASMLVLSQRDQVRGDVKKFRAKVALLESRDQLKHGAKKFAVTFDLRYWKPGTFTYPMQVFLDPDHKFSAQQVRQVQALVVGETIDLGDGRIVQRSQ
ncbi:hypothetical protein [Paraburkholderia sp. DHOC27]|uniref:hypothetical protein n=1 Tax=Paraburkholderia sp. DHOC27 TaxID=2303330 RepID=UPI000E3BB5F5|nr:hypothetical protein [Paraburkholderia sp. DHOC27]RFU45157.1 hypothetical protein D0B32_25820 [Paraburkholderia sp. DHOC27]